MKTLAVYTTVYPGVEPFLPAWLAGVEAQTDRDFELCVGLDGLNVEQVSAAAGREVVARWFPAPDRATPAAVRNLALAILAGQYDGVIFADADDEMLPSRVAAARDALREADVACCAMEIMDGGGHLLGQRFNPDDGISRLERVNVFGFTNSAYRGQALGAFLPAPDECVLMDWYAACACELSGLRLRTDPVLRMRYRQYSGNLAQVVAPFLPEQVVRAARLVAAHHELLRRHVPCRYPADAARYAKAREEAGAFLAAVQGSQTLLNAYVEALNGLRGRHVWWSCVAHPELEYLWKS